MSRDGSRHIVENVKLTLQSMDLVHEAHSLYKLLHAADCFPAPGGLYDGIYAQLAIQRYMQIWLPLLCATPMPERAALVPPLDVAFVWLAHRLAPQSYNDDCTALCEESGCWDPAPLQAFRFSSHTGSSSVAGTRVTAALWASHQQHQTQIRQATLASSADLPARTSSPALSSSSSLPWRELWKQVTPWGSAVAEVVEGGQGNPLQPYFPPLPGVNVVLTQHAALEMQLLTQMQSAAALLVSTLRPCYLDAGFLRQASSRYARFLALNRMVRLKQQGSAITSKHTSSHSQQQQQHHQQQQQQLSSRLLPTSDIHLMWAAHISRGGGAYSAHCQTLFGALLPHEPCMLLHGSTVGTPLGRPNSQESISDVTSLPTRRSSPEAKLPKFSSLPHSPPSHPPPISRVATFSHPGSEHVSASHSGVPASVPRLHFSKSMIATRSEAPSHAHQQQQQQAQGPRISEPGSRSLVPSASLKALFSPGLRISDPGSSTVAEGYEGEADFAATKQMYESAFGEMFDPVGTGPVALHSSTVVTKKMGRLLRYFDPAPKILAAEGSTQRFALVAPEPICTWRAGGHALFMLWLVAHELWELNNVAYGLASFSDVGHSAIRCAVMKALKFCQWKYLPLHEAHPYWASFEISLTPDALDVKAGIFAPSPHRSSNPRSPTLQTSQSAHAGSFYKSPTGKTGTEAPTLLEQQSAAVLRAVVLQGGSHRGFRHPLPETDVKFSSQDGSNRSSSRRAPASSGPLGSQRVVPLNPTEGQALDPSSRAGDQHKGLGRHTKEQDSVQSYLPDLIAMQSKAEEATMRAVDFDDSDDEGGQEAARLEVMRVASHRAAVTAAAAAAAESSAAARAVPRLQKSDTADLQPKASVNSVWWESMLALLPPPSFPSPPTPRNTRHPSGTMSQVASNILQQAVAEGDISARGGTGGSMRGHADVPQANAQLPGIAALMKLGMGGGLPIALYTLLCSDSWAQVVKVSNAEAAREWGVAATSPGAVMTSVGVH